MTRKSRPQRRPGPSGDSSFDTMGDTIADDLTNASGARWQGSLLVPARYAPTVGQDDHLADYRARSARLVPPSEAAPVAGDRALHQADEDGRLPGAQRSAERHQRKDQKMADALGRAHDALEGQL